MWIILRNIYHFIVWLFHDPLHEAEYKIFQNQVNVRMGYGLQDMLLKVIFN